MFLASPTANSYYRPLLLRILVQGTGQFTRYSPRSDQPARLLRTGFLWESYLSAVLRFPLRAKVLLGGPQEGLPQTVSPVVPSRQAKRDSKPAVPSPLVATKNVEENRLERPMD